MLDDLDRFLYSFVIRMEGVRVFKVLSKHKPILTETLDRFDHVGFKTHTGPDVFGLFYDILEGRIIFS